MIEVTNGDLLTAPAEALVNAVNTVGVMGKGIALQFRHTFPDIFAALAEVRVLLYAPAGSAPPQH